MMLEFLKSPLPFSIIFVSLLLIATTIVYYLAKKVRAEMELKDPTANDHLSDFRRLHQDGKISEREFRRVKRTLTEKLQEELKQQEQLEGTSSDD